MKNADLFKDTFGTYATEIWSMPENDFLKWLNEDAEPKTGHWIIIDDCEKFIAKCSKCGRIEDSRMISKYPYCHCGAKMVESEG